MRGRNPRSCSSAETSAHASSCSSRRAPTSWTFALIPSASSSCSTNASSVDGHARCRRCRPGTARRSRASRHLLPGRGDAVERADGGLDRVVDEGVVAAGAPLGVELNRAPLEHRPGELHRDHVRPPGGAVDVEEAQRGAGQAGAVGERVREQLVGLLRRAVDAERVVGRVLLAEREPRRRAVDRARRGEHQVLDAAVPGAVEQLGEAEHVVLDVGARLVGRLADRRRRRRGAPPARARPR